jgi:hypothetical protein
MLLFVRSFSQRLSFLIVTTGLDPVVHADETKETREGESQTAALHGLPGQARQ